MDGFGIDEVQAEYIAEIKLRYLNREYIINRIKEIESLQQEIADLKTKIGDDLKVREHIAAELREIKKKYAKPRQTQLIYPEDITLPDFVKPQDNPAERSFISFVSSQSAVKASAHRGEHGKTEDNETPEKKTKEPARTQQKEVRKEIRKETAKEVSRESPKETPKETLKETPKETLGKIPNKTPFETPKATNKETPKETPPELPSKAQPRALQGPRRVPVQPSKREGETVETGSKKVQTSANPAATLPSNRPANPEQTKPSGEMWYVSPRLDQLLEEQFQMMSIDVGKKSGN